MAKRTSPTQRHTEAAQILYRMANKVGAGPNRTVGYAVEPITPVTPGHGGFYMLQSGPNHNPAYSTASFNQNVGSMINVSGGQLINSLPPHSVIPLYIPSGGTTTTTTHIKQEPGLIQFQNLQNLQNLHQPGARILLTAGPPEGVPLYQGARMANGTLIMNPQSDSPGPSGSLTGSTSTKGRGGRKAARDEKLTPEEDERRKVRRERNKQAAARCRKRRMDHTNVLVEEVEGLEEAGNQIKAEIEEMQREKEEIEYLLQNHRMTCSKEFELPPPPAAVETDVEMEESAAPVPEPEVAMPPPPPAPTVPLIHVIPDKAPEKKGAGATRPASLPVKSTLPTGNLLDLAMPTPSPTKLFFNFDHSGLTPTGLTPTGLTPLIPSCSTDTPQNKSPPRPVDASGESVSPSLVSL